MHPNFYHNTKYGGRLRNLLYFSGSQYNRFSPPSIHERRWLRYGPRRCHESRCRTLDSELAASSRRRSTMPTPASFFHLLRIGRSDLVQARNPGAAPRLLVTTYLDLP